MAEKTILQLTYKDAPALADAIELAEPGGAGGSSKHTTLARVAATYSLTFAPYSHTHVVTQLSDSTAVGRTLLTAASTSVQRAALELGTSATLNVGTAAGTVCAGNDSRLFDAAATRIDLTDGGDTTLHFHATDRARANHTGTQAWGTLTGTPTTLAGYGIVDAVTASALGSHENTASGVHGISTWAATLLNDASASEARTTLGLGGSAVLSVGTAASTVAAGDHTHVASDITLSSPTLSGGTLALDFSSKKDCAFRVTLNANVTSIVFSNVPTGAVRAVVEFRQSGGPYTVAEAAWPVSVTLVNPAYTWQDATVTRYWLETTDGGTTWLVSNNGPSARGFGRYVVVSGTTATLGIADIGATICCTSSSATTLTLSLDLPIAAEFLIVREGSGSVAVARSGTETVNNGTSAALGARYTHAHVYKRAAGAWISSP
jgi:hypothetical protein